MDFVCNYEAFKKGNLLLVKEEILKCTEFATQNNKVIKWIIEVAALDSHQIVQLSALIKNCDEAEWGSDVRAIATV